MLKTKRLEVRRDKVSRTLSEIADHSTDDTPQYFQVTVNVLEGRKLSWANPRSATSYVIVVVDKKKQRTSVRRNMEEPFYRESFVFEIFVSVREVQRTSLWLAVMESRYCAPPRLLGEANVDLAAVWAQPHHAVSHKWAQLAVPKDTKAGPVGFLMVDISIQLKGQVYVMPPVTTDDKIEDNLLLPSGSEQQRASYQLTVYGAYGLPGGPNCFKDKNGKPPNTFVQVTFCDMVAKTGVRHRNNNPMYSEQISMVEMFPNLCQILKLEVCSAETSSNRVLTSTHLRMSQISHGGGNGFLPTFGPSLLHMYGSWSSGALAIGEDGPCHRGAVLVALKTVVPYYKHNLKTVNVEPVATVRLESLWILEDLIIFCTLFEVSMLDMKISGKSCGVAITFSEIPSDNQADKEFTGLMETIKQNKLYYTGPTDVQTARSVYGFLEFPSELPVLQLATRLPDFRFRLYRNNVVHGIVVALESGLDNVEHRLRTHDYESPSELVVQLQCSMDDAAAGIIEFLDMVQCSSSCEKTRRCITELDVKQMQLQKEEMEKIYQRISRITKPASDLSLLSYSRSFSDSEDGGKRCAKLLLAEGRIVIQDLKSLVFKTLNGWPDIVIWLLSSGTRVAYTKVAAADVLHSTIPEQKGRDCGQIKTLYLKPVKCSEHLNIESSCNCTAAKIELLSWLGSYRERGAFESSLPPGYRLRVRDHCLYIKCSHLLILECRVNVYRAKLSHRSDSAINTPFVRVNFMCATKDTQPQQNSVNPVWNEVIRICRYVSTTPQRLSTFPPEVLIEVYDRNDERNEPLGRLRIDPIVDRQDLVPRLQWLDILRGLEPVGQILLSAQLIQLPERLLKTTYYSPAKESFRSPGAKQLELRPEEPEAIPGNLIPYTETYKVDVYWWGLRDVSFTHKPCVMLELDELTVKSGIITNAAGNCNFPNGRTSQVFEGNLDLHCSPLSVKLYDSGTFGRTLFLGLNVVKNPLKYMVSWIPKKEREDSLYSTSIMSTAFVQVSRVVFIKKSTNSNTEDSEDTSSYVSSKTIQQTAKLSIMQRVFSNKEAEEEKCTLLPMFSKAKDQIQLMKKSKGGEKDWWMRYSASQTDNMREDNLSGGRFNVYESELECQPGFSRFRDWCSTLKMYNGKKTGIPEKDDRLHCGYLKVGIVIYKWPPPENTVAVSASGVELHRGHDRMGLSCASRFIYCRKTGAYLRNSYGATDRRDFLAYRDSLWAGERHRLLFIPGQCTVPEGIAITEYHVDEVAGKSYYFNSHPDNDPATFLVRVYVVRAFGLVPKEFAGKTDPYVTVQCGRKVLGDRNCYVTKNDSPVFGKMFELRCSLPEDYLLRVSLLNYNNVLPDDLIGCTFIDLEDRAYSKHRACVGLAAEYTVSGQSKWRDNQKPSEILEELCRRNHLPPPEFPDATSVVVSGVEYRDSVHQKKVGSKENTENVCLKLLHKWNTLPICGYQLVPEHVETRTLYDPEKPEVEQGKIHLWVDMFALDQGVFIPAPVDIKPRDVEDFELRVIVWDVLGVQLKGASDIYVKAWIGPSDEAQDTDIHYRSTDGEGSFNWRMIFHFIYKHSERKLVLHERGPFTEVEEHFPPILIVQVQDSEAAPEEYLGTLMLDLAAMPRGAKLARHCTPDVLVRRKINLFVVRSIRAWWPLKTLDRNTGNYYPAGMIDLEITLLPKEKAAQMPAGIGRASPCPLPYPIRTKSMESSLKPLWEILCHQKAAVVLCVVVLALTIYLFQSTLGHYAHATEIERSPERIYETGTKKIIYLKKR